MNRAQPIDDAIYESHFKAGLVGLGLFMRSGG